MKLFAHPVKSNSPAKLKKLKLFIATLTHNIHVHVEFIHKWVQTKGHRIVFIFHQYPCCRQTGKRHHIVNKNSIIR